VAKIEKLTLGILQARMSSSRLPGKVMMLINGEPMIYRQIERIRLSKSINELVVATSTDPSDDVLVDFLKMKGVSVFRGKLNDVFSRFLEIAKLYEPSAVVRLTGDCPLVMPELIDQMVTHFYHENLDYLSNTLKLTFPDGLDIEVINTNVLYALAELNLSESEQEHVTLGIYGRPHSFKLGNYACEMDLSQERWTVDYAEDLRFVRQVFATFKGSESTFKIEDILSLLSSNSSLRSAISPTRRNEKLTNKLIGE
jgi:spore coat polysaccharide biosynthesis protein SpsF